jgi:hypothetical protein
MSGSPLTADASLRRNEPVKWAKTGTRGLFLSDGNWDSFGDPKGALHETSPPKFSASGRVPRNRTLSRRVYFAPTPRFPVAMLAPGNKTSAWSTMTAID